MYVLRSMLCAVRLCACTLVTTPAVQNSEPCTMELMLITLSKLGYALGVQEHKDRSLCMGPKSKRLWSVRLAVRTIPISSYVLGRTSKRLPIFLSKNSAPVCFIEKLNYYK